MPQVGSQLPSKPRVLLGYAFAVVLVCATVAVLSLTQTRWHAVAPMSLLLIVIIIAARVGGSNPGLLATAVALPGLNYLLSELHDPLTDWPVRLLRLVSLGVIASYIVWMTEIDRRRADFLRRARDEELRNNEVLRIENTQRKRVESELRASEAKFRALAESAPVAIFICHDETISYSNPAATAITGYSSTELFGKNLWDTVAADSRDSVRSRAAARRNGDSVPARFELRILTKAGAQRCLDFTDAVFEFAGKPAILGVALDITERKQAEDAVRNSQQLLNQVLATLPVGVSVTNRSGDIILVNAAVRNIWGDPVLTDGPQRWAQSKGWWHESGARIAPSEWGSARALSAGETSLNELIDVENFSGKHKTLQNSSAPIRSAEGQIVGAVVVNEDVTERVRAEEALQDSADRLQHLSRRLLTLQEEERRHLSRELHDEFGQILATITLHLQAAKNTGGGAAQPSLDESIALLQRAGTQVRNLALELRPMLLETAGLDATLRWLAEQYQQRTGIVTQVVGDTIEVPSELAIACFRVTQEAMTNVVRHARARHVWIELSQSEGRLRLMVRDDGTGFDVGRTLEHAAEAGNLGLIGMRERVEILGGQLTIDSQSGHGTCICVSLPVSGPALMPEQQRA
jgi:PAS domain S-box-containing protein